MAPRCSSHLFKFVDSKENETLTTGFSKKKSSNESQGCGECRKCRNYFSVSY